MLHAVIMAGGSGTRFWPRSRRARPKQLIQIAGPQSLLAATVERLKGAVPPRNIWVVTTRDLAAAILKEVPDLAKENILAEPAGRDTAAAIGFAAVAISARDPEAVLAVMPSDHTIRPAAKFRQALAAAARTVEQEDALLAFAVRPTYAATGYGYIEKGDSLEDSPADLTVFRARLFTEKPDLATAKSYLKHGRFLWNSGIFVWRARTILDEIARHLPAHGALLAEIRKTWGTPKAARALARAYPGFRRISIDYGVMEPAARAGRVLMAPATFQWDDVGSWVSLANHLPADADGNVSEGTVITIDSAGNIVSSEGKHLIATLGVANLVVVHTPDATLVTTREKAQEIKKVVATLEAKKLDRYL